MSASPAAIARTIARASCGRRASARVLRRKNSAARWRGVPVVSVASTMRRLEPLDLLVQREEEDVLLRAEVLVERAERDVGLLRDVAQPHRFEAALLGEVDGGVHDAAHAPQLVRGQSRAGRGGCGRHAVLRGGERLRAGGLGGPFRRD